MARTVTLSWLSTFFTTSGLVVTTAHGRAGCMGAAGAVTTAHGRAEGGGGQGRAHMHHEVRMHPRVRMHPAERAPVSAPTRSL